MSVPAHAAAAPRRALAIPVWHTALLVIVLAYLIDLYSLIVLVAVVVSWLQLPPDHVVVRVTNRLTEPVLGRIRRVIPTMGGLDFSAMLLLFALRFLRGLVW